MMWASVTINILLMGCCSVFCSQRHTRNTTYKHVSLPRESQALVKDEWDLGKRRTYLLVSNYIIWGDNLKRRSNELESTSGRACGEQEKKNCLKSVVSIPFDHLT